MVQRKTVESWGFSSLGFEINEFGEVVKIFCKTCREFYSSEKEKNTMLSKVSGSSKFIDQSNAYIDGTTVIKKNNFEKHLTYENHKKAALRLKELQLAQSKESENVENSESTSSSGAPKQTLIRPMLQKMTAANECS